MILTDTELHGIEDLAESWPNLPFDEFLDKVEDYINIELPEQLSDPVFAVIRRIVIRVRKELA